MAAPRWTKMHTISVYDLRLSMSDFFEQPAKMKPEEGRYFEAIARGGVLVPGGSPGMKWKMRASQTFLCDLNLKNFLGAVTINSPSENPSFP